MRGTLHRGGGGGGMPSPPSQATKQDNQKKQDPTKFDGLLVKDSAGEDEKMSVCHYSQKMFFDGVNVLD